MLREPTLEKLHTLRLRTMAADETKAGHRRVAEPDNEGQNRTVPPRCRHMEPRWRHPCPTAQEPFAPISRADSFQDGTWTVKARAPRVDATLGAAAPPRQRPRHEEGDEVIDDPGAFAHDP
jgi:hypothetical protein